jgi:hypothetical protein
MPTALIRSKMSRSRPDRSDSANHSCKRSAENAAAESASFHRLQISANTTIAASSNPTKRIMMVPTCWGCVRNGIGSLLSGRMVFMQETPKVTCTWSRTGPERFKARLDMRSSSQASGREFPARSPASSLYPSAVTQAVRGTLPLRHIVGDHARRLHCRLAELGIARNLALNALALGMQDITQALEF